MQEISGQDWATHIGRLAWDLPQGPLESSNIEQPVVAGIIAGKTTTSVFVLGDNAHPGSSPISDHAAC